MNKKIGPKSRGVSMKSFNKIFFLTVLGLGVYVSEARSNDEIQDKIHKKVEARVSTLAGTGKPSTQQVIELLTALKTDLLEVLETAPDTTQYKQLKQAVEKLEPSKMLAMVGQVRIILANIGEQTKTLILEHIPEKIKPFLV